MTAWNRDNVTWGNIQKQTVSNSQSSISVAGQNPWSLTNDLVIRSCCSRCKQKNWSSCSVQFNRLLVVSNLCSKLLYIEFFLTQVGFEQLLAPSQTGSSISVWSVYQPARWQRRRWESAEFPWRGTGGGHVLVSHPSTDRPQRQEIHSSDSTRRHLEGKHTEAYTKHRNSTHTCHPEVSSIPMV